MREHVEQNLGVTVGIDVPPIAQKHFLLQFSAVDEVAVMRQQQPEGCVDVERLRLFRIRSAARSRIAHMRDPGHTGQRTHVPGPKHITNQPVRLVHVK